MSSNAARRSDELKAEQRRFDEAARERECIREALRSTAGDGAADAWAAQALMRMRRRTLEGLGSPNDSVAFGRLDYDTTETYYIGNRRIEATGIADGHSGPMCDTDTRQIERASTTTSRRELG